MSDPVVVECHCPGTPHEHDEFFLADELPIEAGIAAAAALVGADGGNPAAVLIGALLRNGAIERWNLVDEDGTLLPISPATVSRRVTWMKGGVELSNAALERYVAADRAPFGSSTSAKKNGKLSRSGRTDRSTSAKTQSSSTPPAPSE